jgi:hypothetical protein
VWVSVGTYVCVCVCVCVYVCVSVLQVAYACVCSYPPLTATMSLCGAEPTPHFASFAAHDCSDFEIEPLRGTPSALTKTS